jgi:hypothetical protein
MRYYDFNENWSKLEPFVNHPNVREAIESNYNMYLLSGYGVPLGDMTLEQVYEFKLRTEYGDNWKSESVDVREGERQPWWILSCPHSCHWSVNVGLELAKLAEPDRPWRILNGKKHSTVWDGKETLFDLFYAISGVDPDECYTSATTEGEEQPVGQRNDGHDMNPWWVPYKFKAPERKQYSMDQIEKNAQVYLNNLVQSLKTGASSKVDDDDAYILAIFYESTTQFLEARRLKKRVRAATILEQIAHTKIKDAADTVNKKVERTVERVFKSVNQPNHTLAFGNPREFLYNDTVVAGFKITEKGVEDLYPSDEPLDPVEFLRQTIAIAVSTRWDWALFVQDNQGPSKVWTFNNLRAIELEPTDAETLLEPRLLCAA